MKKIIIALIVGLAPSIAHAAEEVTYDVITSTAVKKTVILTGAELQYEKDLLQSRIDTFSNSPYYLQSKTFTDGVALMQAWLTLLGQAN